MNRQDYEYKLKQIEDTLMDIDDIEEEICDHRCLVEELEGTVTRLEYEVTVLEAEIATYIEEFE